MGNPVNDIICAKFSNQKLSLYEMPVDFTFINNLCCRTFQNDLRNLTQMTNVRETSVIAIGRSSRSRRFNGQEGPPESHVVQA